MKANVHISQGGRVDIRLVAESPSDKRQITRLKNCWPISFNGGIRAINHITFIGESARARRLRTALRMAEDQE